MEPPRTWAMSWRSSHFAKSSEMYEEPLSDTSLGRWRTLAFVARRIFFTICVAGSFSGTDFCLIFTPCEGYDEPEILPSSTHPICLTSADGAHRPAGLPAADACVRPAGAPTPRFLP